MDKKGEAKANTDKKAMQKTNKASCEIENFLVRRSKS
jgi:hypothetical protein